jgi:uncharacterized lipoprotein YddW (UPF0748 family)
MKLITLSLTCVLLAIQAAKSQPNSARMIEECRYANNSAAQTAWKASEISPSAESVMQDGHPTLRFACPFGDQHQDRVYWDHPVKLDLTAARGFEFLFNCPKTLPVSYFAVYLQSGKGWYHSTFFPDSAGWNTIRINKSDMKTEGEPAGWNQIRAIRISAWRARNENSEMFVADFKTIPPLPAPGTLQAAQEALDESGEIASFQNFAAATNAIAKLASGNPLANEALNASVAQHERAVKLISDNKFNEAVKVAKACREQLLDAYCLAQKPEPGEFRAFWCHSPYGVAGMDWDTAIRRLSESGFTAIIPNMLTAGSAAYESKVLPVVPQVAERGDQLQQCLAACRKYGMKIYVWKLDWNLGWGTPRSFIDRMRKEHRLQASSEGKEELWLCPSNPENQKLEEDAMLEVVRNYDVDGIHFDYIRYPDVDHCFCDGCKERFQSATGAKLQNWPSDVLPNGPLRQQWLDWRRSNITTVVKAVSEQARAIKPNIKLSAAVFRYWITDRDAVGQDWKIWCDRGYLDFVCPMDYTPSVMRFDDMVTQQVEWAGKAACYPGLGMSASTSRFGVDRAIQEINIARAHHTGGFVIFNYGTNECENILPALAKGITHPQK